MNQELRNAFFLGFSPSQKGYKLYSIDTQHVFVSRDVVFHENIFPFKNSEKQQDIQVPLLPITSDLTDDVSDSTGNIEGEAMVDNDLLPMGNVRDNQ